MAFQIFWNKNRRLNHMNRGGDCQLQQHQGAGNSNQYGDNSSFEGLSVR